MENSFLLLVKEGLIIEAIPAGHVSIARAKETFVSYYDDCSFIESLDNEQAASEEARVNVYKVIKEDSLFQIFGSLNADLGKLCLTQGQIINFCQKNPEHLGRSGYAALFLFRENNEFFVAEVIVDSIALYVCVKSLEDVGYEDAHSLIVPAAGF